MYNEAQEILSTLQVICENRKQDNTKNSYSVADELLKFKQLLDAGAIIQEEYG